MDPIQITSLANLLRDSGDKVLNSEFKLTLSGSLLRALNDSFTLITAEQSAEFSSPLSFQVVQPNHSKSDVFRDLQLIHDFVQKTIILCITHLAGDDYFDGTIDISKFHSLKILEIHKVNIKQIIGIQPLRGQLQHLICVRCLNAIDDVITYCGGDRSNGFVWNELKYADFSYNALKTIDKSLEFAQWLQQLNLSHNQLISCEAIKWLPNLKILNLSFNRLTIIPNFHMESSRRLQILILNHNFIENLNGLQRLDALTELDLSNNCLLDHSYLLPLHTLMTLKYLNLFGNPLHCHPNHRQATAYYLHKNTASVKFILDTEPLSKVEKQLIGNYQNNQYLLTASRLSMMTPVSAVMRSSGQTTPRISQQQTPASSVGSISSFKLNESAEMLSSTTTSEMTSSINDKQKKLRRRTVDLEQNNSSTKNNSVLSKSKSKTSTEISASTDHLETKKQIDDLRKKFGAGWLHSDNSHMIKSVIGLNDENCDDGDDKDSRLTSKKLIDDLLGQKNNTQIDLSIDNLEFVAQNDVPVLETSTPKSFKGNLLAKDSSRVQGETEDGKNKGDSVYKSASDEGSLGYNSAIEDDSNILNVIYSSTTDETEVSEPEDNENTYIVYGADQNNELLLTVSDTSIKEQEVLTRRTKTKWSLKILQSCDRIKANTLRINFDTVKKDKKERVYTVEEGLCQQLENYLRGILSKRLLSEMNQTVYRCVNCACQFSRENTYKKNLNIYCPECKSAYVVEVHEPPPTVSSTMEYDKELLMDKASSVPTGSSAASTSTLIATDAIATTVAAASNAQGINENSGIGKGMWRLTTNKNISSAGSLNESSSCSKISNSQSSFDSNQSVAGSSTNERDLDLLNFSGRNYESDVEILSNPSQSSIEVLDGGGITTSGSGTAHSSRKTSEERKILQIPSLETIEDRSIGRNNNLWNLDLQNLVLNNESTTTIDTNADDATVEHDQSETVSGMESEQKKTGSVVDLNAKKNLLSNVNLTESSSSGSVTDSICTSYEQSDKGGSTSDGTSGKGEGITTSSGDNKSVNNSKITMEKENKKDESIISSMFGGLFQSTNILMSRTQKSSTTDITQTTEKFKFNYEDFGEVDHRLKLYFYQTKFDDPNEHFKWLVKGKMYNEQTNELFDGIIVMSTTKLYIMEIINNENDDISKWLKQVLVVKIDRIDQIQLLPWHIGVAFQIRNWGSFLLILQDILRTDSLLLFFANNPIPTNCVIEYQISERILKKFPNCTDSEQLKMFSLLNKCEITTTNYDNNIFSPTGLFTTDTHLYLTTSNLAWLSCYSNATIELSSTQLMSNLVDIDRLTTREFSINFLDETQDKTELWKCEFETSENADSCLNAIGQSWEKLFGVPLGCN